jgi:hypothetical protein
MLLCSNEFLVDGHCPYSNLANNLFASACDNLRPIIAFGTRILRSSSWPSVKLALIQVGKGSTHTSMNERSPRLNDDGNLIVVAVTEPVEGHQSFH